MPYILIGFVIVLVMCVLTERFFGEPIPMDLFILGPDINSTNLSKLPLVVTMESIERKQKKPKPCHQQNFQVFLIVCCSASIFFITAIFLSVFAYDNAYILQELVCQDGFYDVKTKVSESDGVHVPICTGKIINIKNINILKMNRIQIEMYLP